MLQDEAKLTSIRLSTVCELDIKYSLCFPKGQSKVLVSTTYISIYISYR